MSDRPFFTIRFWADAGERAIKTAAQTAATFFTLGAVTSLDASITRVAASAGIGALFSIITSAASAPLSDTISPASLVTTKPPPPGEE